MNKNETIIENRSIDFIPANERYGKVFSQFTLWLAANLQITALITGALCVVFGGDVFWSLIGLVIGQVIGCTIMALHAAQGPKLGLPQMISSRVQFGVYGAALPIVLVCIMYIGFTATGVILAGQALGHIFHISATLGVVLFSLVTLFFAFAGYHLIHQLGKLAAIIGVIAFAYLFIAILSDHSVSTLLANRVFKWSTFLTAIGLSAAWQIAFGPYVADYSRYLPDDTSSKKVFFAVGLGSGIGAQIAMTLGVFVAAIANGKLSGDEVGYIVGLGGTGVIAFLLFFSIAFGKLPITTLNAYGSFMCISTIATASGKQQHIAKSTRLIVIAAVIILAGLVAILGEHSFLPAFKNFLLFLLTFFTPWSAINLVDYYFFSHEKIDRAALIDPDGKYGKYNWMALIIYIVGVIIQMPFLASGLYTGPIAKAMGYVDLSWVVGFVVPAIVYYFLRGHQFLASTSTGRA